MRYFWVFCFSFATLTLCADEELDLDQLPYFRQEQVAKNEKVEMEKAPVAPAKKPAEPEKKTSSAPKQKKKESRESSRFNKKYSVEE